MTNDELTKDGKVTDEGQRQIRELTDYLQLDPKTGEPPELHPDLKPHVQEMEGWSVLKHPILFDIPHSPMTAGLCNVRYVKKKAALEKSEAEGDWDQCIWFHERPYRIEAFAGYAEKMTDSDYWELLGAILTDTENMHQFADNWRQLIESERPGRELMMNDGERQVLAELPDVVKVHRGTNADDGMGCGLSWSLSYTKAKWFAHRDVSREMGLTPRLLIGNIKREKIIAYFDARGEEEVVLFPEDVRDLEVRVLR